MKNSNLSQLNLLVLQQLGADLDHLPVLKEEMDSAAKTELLNEHCYLSSAVDAANHGAAGGVSGFIYYDETYKFTIDNWPLIWGTLRELAEEHGSTISSLVATFRYCKYQGWNGLEVEILLYELALRHSGKGSELSEEKELDVTLMGNLLAWFALEATGAAIEELLEL